MRVEHVDLFSLLGVSIFPIICGKNEYYLVEDTSSAEELFLCSRNNFVSAQRTENGILLYGSKVEFQKFLEYLAGRDCDFCILLRNQLKAAMNTSLLPSPVSLPNSGTLSFEKPLIMGILNVTPDSFYGKSRIRSMEMLVKEAKKMVDDGADIIDIGGESTRPGSDSIDTEEEIRRVVPAIKALSAEVDIPISVDTYRSRVARLAVESGASIVNDISSLDGDPDMSDFVSAEKIPLILMHMRGKPKNMQDDPHYENVVREISEYFSRKIEYACYKGLPREQIILDPGIGFGKRVVDNIDIISNIDEFKKFKLPLLVGASRKSFIGRILNQPDPYDRLEGTLATTAFSVGKGVNIFRVHDVRQNRLVADMAFSFAG